MGKRSFNMPSGLSIFEKLKLMQECPLCSTDYNSGQIITLDESDNSHLVHISCGECGNSVLVMILISSLGMSSVGMITDLSAQDVRRLRRKPPIDEDMLLDFHKLICFENKFEGAIVSLVKK